MGDNPCCVWDFTLPAAGVEVGLLVGWLEKVGKEWAVQREKGATTGFEHFQGRVSLKLKQREFWWGPGRECECPWPQCHWSRTSSVCKGDAFYVLKEESRIEGPWTSKDPKPTYIPRQVRAIIEWRPFQIRLFGLTAHWDGRIIHCVVDVEGGTGKSVLVTAMICSGDWEEIPPCNNMRDIMRAVCCIGPKKGYVIDMPRALPKTDIAGFWAGIESVKNGRAWDDRYEWKRIIFDSPAVVVFMNEVPKTEYLSRDRWRFWKICRQTWDLVPFAEDGRGAASPVTL